MYYSKNRHLNLIVNSHILGIHEQRSIVHFKSSFLYSLFLFLTTFLNSCTFLFLHCTTTSNIMKNSKRLLEWCSYKLKQKHLNQEILPSHCKFYFKTLMFEIFQKIHINCVQPRPMGIFYLISEGGVSFRGSDL